MDRETLSREEWEAWHRSEEMGLLREFLEVQVRKLKDNWAAGEFTATSMSASEIAVANLAAVDNIRFATDLINMTFEDYQTAMEKE